MAAAAEAAPRERTQLRLLLLQRLLMLDAVDAERVRLYHPELAQVIVDVESVSVSRQNCVCATVLQFIK